MRAYISDGGAVGSDHYPGTRDVRNHPKVPLAPKDPSEPHARLLPKPPLAADHNPHILLGNSTVAATVLKFAPRNLKFILLACHPAKRARASHSCPAGCWRWSGSAATHTVCHPCAVTTYRFRYFGKGEFGWRQPALVRVRPGPLRPAHCSRVDRSHMPSAESRQCRRRWPTGMASARLLRRRPTKPHKSHEIFCIATSISSSG